VAPAWRNSYLRYKTYFLNVSSQYSKREDVKAFMELLLSLATVSIFAIFALRPTLITIAQLFKEIEAKKAIIAKLDEKIKTLSLAQENYESQKDNIALLEIAIPASPNPDSFIKQIEGVIGRNAVGILSINLGESTLLGTPKEGVLIVGAEPLPEGAAGLSFTINVSSGYPTLASFLADLEALRRPVKIGKVSINTSITDLGRQLILVVVGQTPYLRETEVASSP
jgi:hypothetical protein